jgi:hypothetical protein
VAREARFAPLLVSVENPGKAITVDVKVDLGERAFTRSLVLPAAATRRLSFVVPMVRDVHTALVRVLADGTEMARAEADLRAAMVRERIVVAISGDFGLDAMAAADDTRVVYPRVDDLPDSWAGYDGVDLVVVHNTSFQQLRPAQVTALERWVAAGGSLVATGGAAALTLAGAGLGALLPVEVTGLLERTDLPSLAAFLGTRQGPRGAVYLAVSSVRAGSALAEQDGIPLVVERRLGRGAIRFLAFDPTAPPFATWEGTAQLWRQLAETDRLPVLQAASAAAIDDPWMKLMLDFPPFSFPSILGVFVFAAGCFVPLALLVPQRRFSLKISARLRAGLLVALPAIACLAGWVMYNRVLFRGDSLALETSVVEALPGTDTALVTQRIGFFAAARRQIEVAFDLRDVVVQETGRAGFSMETGDRTVVTGLDTPRFAARLLVANAVISMPVRAEVTMEAAAPGTTAPATAAPGTAAVTAASARLRCALSNQSPRALRGALLVRDGRGFPIGDVAPHTSVVRTFAIEAGIEVREPAKAAMLAGGDRRARLWRDALADAARGDGAVLAWLDGPALSAGIFGAYRSADRAALSLLVVEAQ